MIWRWLVDQGIYKDAVGAAVAAVVGPALAWRPLRAHKRRQERIAEGQDKIADALDADTPGGLHEVVKALHRTGPTVRGKL